MSPLITSKLKILTQQEVMQNAPSGALDEKSALKIFMGLVGCLIKLK
jgi:hypothetical protein